MLREVNEGKRSTSGTFLSLSRVLMRSFLLSFFSWIVFVGICSTTDSISIVIRMPSRDIHFYSLNLTIRVEFPSGCGRPGSRIVRCV